VRLVRGLVAAAERASELPLEEGVSYATTRVAELAAELSGLDAGDRAILHYLVRATLAPRALDRSALLPLREAGFDDRGLHDIVNVIACFAYMNRLADGLGVQVQGEREEWARRLFGDEAWEEHVRWAAAETD
jgi:alkylhydroperoxidase family enzyme